MWDMCLDKLSDRKIIVWKEIVKLSLVYRIRPFPANLHSTDELMKRFEILRGMTNDT